jgi:hypothetical protein
MPLSPFRLVAALALWAALALGPAAPVAAETPAGWTAHAVGPISIALPADWQVMEESDDFSGFFSGDMAERRGHGLALGLDSDPDSYLNDVTAVAAGQATLDGVVFDRYSFTADDGEGMAGEGEIYISAAPLSGEDHALILLTALNAPFADRADDYAAILATLDLAAVAPAEPEAPATAGTGALGGLVTLALPEGWHSYDSPGELGLLPVGAEGSVVLARGAAARALQAEAAGAGAATSATVLGQPSRMQTWAGTLAEFSDGAGFVTGSYRLHLLDTCLPGGEPLAVLIGGTDRFLAGADLATVLAGITLTLPAGSAPCAAAEPEPAAEPAAPAASAAAPVAPPLTAALPAVPGAAALYPEDTFTAESADWTLYQNGRYGTFVSFPSGYFRPDPPADAADGRSFASVDGQASFFVFAQWNALGLDQPGLIAQDKALMGDHRSVTYEDGGPGWYVLSGRQEPDQIYYRRVLVEGPDGLIQTFEILYPAARKAEFDPIVTYMASTFGPGTSWGAEDMTGTDPGTAQQGGAVRLGPLYTPERGTPERKAIMDAARVPVESVLGLPVIFVVSVLRTDGTWAYLQAQPRNPDGGALDWGRTPLAQDWQNGFVSDTVMVLLQNGDGGWAVADYVVGPTDVYWYSWIDMFGLPEALFLP